MAAGDDGDVVTRASAAEEGLRDAALAYFSATPEARATSRRRLEAALKEHEAVVGSPRRYRRLL